MCVGRDWEGHCVCVILCNCDSITKSKHVIRRPVIVSSPTYLSWRKEPGHYIEDLEMWSIPVFPLFTVFTWHRIAV